VPVDTRSLLALSTFVARLYDSGGAQGAPPSAPTDGPSAPGPGGPRRPAPSGRRRVVALGAASIGAGLVCGLLVPVEASSAATPAPAARPSHAGAGGGGTSVSPAVLLVGTPSPFAGVAAPARNAAVKAAAPRTATAARTATVATKPHHVAGVTAVRVGDPPPPRGGLGTSPRTTAVMAAGSTAYVPHKPLPAHSGSGRRIVYAERAAHLWVVGADGVVLRDYAVTGRVGRPKPGVYHVYSKSTVAINPGEKLRFEYMVRFAVGITGARIGFHTIPRSYDGIPIQKESQLGRAIGAGGCVRQSRADAVWLYGWSHVGDTVVVRL